MLIWSCLTRMCRCWLATGKRSTSSHRCRRPCSPFGFVLGAVPLQLAQHCAVCAQELERAGRKRAKREGVPAAAASKGTALTPSGVATASKGGAKAGSSASPTGSGQGQAPGSALATRAAQRAHAADPTPQLGAPLSGSKRPRARAAEAAGVTGVQVHCAWPAWPTPCSPACRT